MDKKPVVETYKGPVNDPAYKGPVNDPAYRGYANEAHKGPMSEADRRRVETRREHIVETFKERTVRAAELIRSHVRPDITNLASRDAEFLKAVCKELGLPETIENSLQVLALLIANDVPTLQEYPKWVGSAEDKNLTMVNDWKEEEEWNAKFPMYREKLDADAKAEAEAGEKADAKAKADAQAKAKAKAEAEAEADAKRKPGMK